MPHPHGQRSDGVIEMEKEEGALESIVGVRLSPSERKLIVMKEDAIQYYRKYPKELSALRSVRSRLISGKIHVRVSIPETIHEAVLMLDSSAMKSVNRAVVNMIILQIDAIIEEATGD